MLYLLFLLLLSSTSSLSLTVTPFTSPLSLSLTPLTFTVCENLLSISGEDFTVYSSTSEPLYKIIGSNKVPFGIGGAVLDKLELRYPPPSNAEICTIERRLISPTTTYDIYITGRYYGKIVRSLNPIKKVYDFYYGEVKWYTATCSNVLSRKFVINDVRTRKKVGEFSRNLIEFKEDVDSYGCVVEVGGVDVGAVVALVCVVDEDHDEEVEKKRKIRKEKKK
ncbi:hypothetical protein TrST_g7866 [Triparma strigata]|uniref:Uncharacterized protein n=1 Tax=Triparma strigata TaxID=1606541 RepID=A0A9W7AWY1_9STRA|nr:hypothetical protein TrST_g7866 [Triparma strigata]